MKAGVPKELVSDEQRVAVIPTGMAPFQKAGIELVVETGAGERAGYADAEYEGKGAAIAASRDELFEKADAILTFRTFQGAVVASGEADDDLARLREGQTVVGMLDPLAHPQAVARLAERKVTAFAMELIPRITRGQAMDVLSSMATVAGYKAVLLAAAELPRLFPMLMTAAGTVQPARVFVIGAGVAGLQAIATAKRLGAVVEAYDVRPAVKEQVESLGGKFIELELETGGAEDKGGYAKAQDEEFYRRQRELMAKVLAQTDVVITTAAIPGRKAPTLVTREMVEGMRPRTVIVDMAAETGGNCELTQLGETVEHQGVRIMGPSNLPGSIPQHASQLYCRNLSNFMTLAFKDGQLGDLEDEILAGTLVCKDGEVVHSRVAEALQTSKES